MAATSVFEQHITFTVQLPSRVDTISILANNFIATLPSNSSNGVVTFNAAMLQYYQWDGTNLIQFERLDIVVYVTPQFQITIQQNVAGLQTAFPAYVINTYGLNSQFGH